MKVAYNIVTGQIKDHVPFGGMGTYPFGLSCERASWSATCQHCHFGRLVATRAYSSGAYRYACLPVTCLPIGKRQGFNGKEKDGEGLGGGGNTYDYGFRIYNPSLGKFLSTDPLFKSYPWYTPYQFAGNLPIAAIDLDGLEECLVNTYGRFGVTVMYSITFLQVEERFLNESQGLCVGIGRDFFASYQISPSEAKEAYKTKAKNAGVSKINTLSDLNMQKSCNDVISKSYSANSTTTTIDENGNTVTKFN